MASVFFVIGGGINIDPSRGLTVSSRCRFPANDESHFGSFVYGQINDPFLCLQRTYPSGGDMDMQKMTRIKIDDLQLRPDVFATRLERRASLRETISKKMNKVEEAVKDYQRN